jgi:prevent-host-death family protein
MKKVALSAVKDDLSKFLRWAEKEDIVITRHGRPAGILIGFESEDDWFDYRLEHDPRFLRRMESARWSLRAGHGVRVEDMPDTPLSLMRLSDTLCPAEGPVPIQRARQPSLSILFLQPLQQVKVVAVRVAKANYAPFHVDRISLLQHPFSVLTSPLASAPRWSFLYWL